MRAALSLAITSALLAACGGNDGTKNETIDYSKLETTPNSAAHLVLVDDEQLGVHLKNGMRLQLAQGYAPPMFEAVPGAPVPTTDANSGGSRGNFTETNVHVEGVDEADYAKYDGKHWFVATYPRYDIDRPDAKPGFQVVATDPATPDADIISSFSFSDDWGDVGALYLVKNGEDTSHVASVRSQWGNVYPMLPGFPIDLARPAIGGVATDALIWPGPRNSKVQIQLVDVSDPSKPEQDWKIELDGSLINSRKIGETLYLITRYDPWISTLKFEAADKGARTANETALADTDIEELVPHYRVGDAEYPLTRDCYVQQGLEDYHGLDSLVHITAIDLAGQKVLSSTCLNSSVENLSMSPDSLYLTGTIYDRTNGQHSTVVHKFTLAESGPEYAATGNVKGGLNRTTDPQFRMDEHKGDFRIVTSTWNNTGPEHRLTILRQRGKTLVLQGELPNVNSPGPIGKPGEDIYAVRFVGDRAYVVTFQRTDPLYTLDLSEPGQPRTIGELEIPGFATYMHPVGEGLLFTLGHSADDTGRVTGIKADLFDVAGDQPKIINSVKLSDVSGYSEALSNLHALSVLQHSDDELRFALPVTRYDNSTWSSTGLQLLEITGLSSGTAKLTDAGTIIVEGPGSSRYPGQGVDRGILHNNAVFYAHNNAIWAANWDKPKEAKGPILGDPIACTLEARPSLAVHLFPGDRSQTADLCLATVTAVQGETRYELEGYPAPAPTADPARPSADLLPAPPIYGGCIFSGPHEVGGYFDVHISMRGYLPESLKEVYVPKGICHVQTQQLNVVLKPE